MTQHALRHTHVMRMWEGGSSVLTLKVLHRQRFVDRYPDLSVWLAEPLPVRLGRLPGEPRTTPSSRAAYEARTYLVFLWPPSSSVSAADHDVALAVIEVQANAT